MNKAVQTPLHSTDPVISYLDAGDGHRIKLYQWAPANSPVAVVHICHGMAEHGLRYHDLAVMLTEHGYHVCAHDHRGHGQDINPENRGHYADRDGWNKVTRDVMTVQHTLRARFPEQPQFLVGHSMGSFIAQGALIASRVPLPLAGLVLSGSSRDPLLKLAAFRAIVTGQRILKGKRGKSGIIHGLTFGSFARAVKNRQTDFDWISRDSERVAQFIADPHCGFDCSTQLWQDLGMGLIRIRDNASLTKLGPDLPVLIISGGQDPVGEFGKGPKRLADAYKKAGFRDTTLELFPKMRHEPFNEKEREEAYTVLTRWLDEKTRLAQG